MLSTKLFSSVRAIVAAGLLACSLLPASAAPAAAIANIPFEFEVDGKMMPAGRYTVSEGMHRNVIQLTDNNGRAVMFATSELGDPSKIQKSRLVFERGDRGYQMAEIWISSMPTGKALSRKASSVKTTAGNYPTDDRLTIALLTN